MSLMGTRVQRVEDQRLLTEGGRYLDDIVVNGALHVCFVRATTAHARVAAVDTIAASRAPGVAGVYCAADLDVAPIGDPDIAAMFSAPIVRPFLADGVVRFVGEPIVAVVAESAVLAADAATLVSVDYEPLPVVIDAEAALLPGAPVLFASAANNVVARFATPSNDAPAATPMAGERTSATEDDFFAGCDVVVRQRILNSRIAASPLETRGAISHWVEGRLHHWTPTQRPHGIRDTLAAYLGIEKPDIRLRTPDVGGGFGVKIGVAREEVVVALIARLLGRPVRWHETRSEAMLAMGHGRGQIQYAELGGTRDGDLLAYRLRIVQEAGAYPDVGAILPVYTMLMAPGVYTIGKVSYAAESVVTNTAPTLAFRGAGRPEATAAIERAVDLFAAEVGLDPAELRRKNFIPRNSFPYTTPLGACYDSGDYEGVLDKALAAVRYPALREEQAQRRAAGSPLLLGIGMSVYVEITNAPGGADASTITVDTEGKATVTTGASPTGQGHETVWATLVADRLGLALEDVRVVYGDTDLIDAGRGTMGSSSLQVAGVAVHDAAVGLLEHARLLAAEELEANPADFVAERGALEINGSPQQRITWKQLATAAAKRGQTLDCTASFEAPAPTFPFGAHVAVVELDVATGEVTLLRLIGVDDAGVVINPDLFEGQLHGGFAQGAAQALFEAIVYDTSGNLLTSSFADYAIVSAAELPPFEVVASETPTPHNSLGAKGVGESGTIGATPAVQNAVIDALAHLGVRHIDMPATPERLWRAITAAAASAAPHADINS